MADPTLPAEPNVPDQTGMNPRQRAVRRNERLRSILQRWIAHWRDINDYILPRRLSYLVSDKNDGSKKNGKILRSTATKAARILAAGKTANQTSPVRPWFRVEPPEHLKGNYRCASWAAKTEQTIYKTLAGSNLYSCLHELWFEEGTFGTSALYIEEDDRDDVIGYIFPLGQYALSSTGKRRVDGIWRDFSTMTVEEVITEFGKLNVSPELWRRYTRGEYDEPVHILHVIEPNINRDTGRIDNRNMPWKSTWWELECGDEWGKPLRVSGFEEQPFMVARWNVLGDDLYGSDCPGMDALGDTKGIQHVSLRRAEAFDKGLRPPTKSPTAARTSKISLLPGDNTYIDETAQGTKLEAIFEVKPEWVTMADNSMDADDRRIYSTFFADLFQMFLLDDAQQPRTATDINRRYEEKMLQLGPVVELDNNDVLDLLIHRVYRILVRRGKIDPPPPELAGQKMQIVYISNMAQAQKLLGTASVERYLSITGSVSAIRADVLDLPNFDKILRNYADMLGMRPEEINPEEVVAALREARQQKEQMAESIAASKGAADAAKAAAGAELTPDSVLSRLMAGVGQSPLGAAYGRA